jgi:hypothetical protein
MYRILITSVVIVAKVDGITSAKSGRGSVSTPRSVILAL